MKVIILTNKNVIIEYILKEFSERKIKIDAIIVEEQPVKTMTEKIKKYIPVFIINLSRKLRGYGLVRDYEYIKTYFKFSENVSVVSNFNSQESASILQELKPDLVILGGSRILKQQIISIPSIGILNAHPGLLPKYRGVNVMLWSIYHNDPIGVTVHFIDKGIDTGRICTQQQIEIQKNDTLESLRVKANEVSAKLLATVTTAIISNNLGPTMENALDKGKQYYQMDKKRVEEVNQKLKKL
ncbi:MAG TPA: formyl transferase [Bacteroidia bacterium]|jgi:methionyl-tRNA formyltransferase|nr:formyl transferase [Bacteroidia bacterium]